MKRIFFLLAILFLAGTAGAQLLPPSEINNTELILDCMKTRGSITKRQLAYWYPSDFWKVMATQMRVRQDVVEMIEQEMKPYALFAVVDYNGETGRYQFRSEAELRASIRLRDSSGALIKPLDLTDLSPMAGEMLGNMRPMLAQMLGQLGEGMHLFVFPTAALKGSPSLTMGSNYRFGLVWEGTVLNWTLPLPAALVPKSCPVDGETMKGNWKFCPVHGAQLK